MKVDTISQSKSKLKTADLRYNEAATYAALSYEALVANRAYWTIDIPGVSGVQSAHTVKRSDVRKRRGRACLDETRTVFEPFKPRA